MVRAARPLVAAPFVLATACLNAPIETSPDAAAGANGNGNGNGEECTLQDDTLQPETFEASVLPGLEASCSLTGCHGPTTPNGNFAVHGGAYLSADEGEHCNFVRSVVSFIQFADRESPGDSPMLQAIDGRTPHTGGTWEADQEPRPSIEVYLQAIAGSGGGAPGLDVFETEIQPILDTAGDQGCALGGACHASGAGTFTLHSEPDPGSVEMRANYDASVERSDPAAPDTSVLVQRATEAHFGSPVVSDAERQTLIDWISTLNQ